MFRYPIQRTIALATFVHAAIAFAATTTPEVGPIQHATITVADGATIAYHIRPGTGPTLVLIPGSWGDYHAYDGLLLNLPSAYNVVIVEMRGHGDSAPPTLNGSIELFADDVLSVVKHLELKHFYVGGHSIGGMIAIEIAGRAPAGLLGAISMEGWTHYQVQREAFGGNDAPTLSPELAREREALHARVKDRLTPEQREAFGGVWRKWDGSKILETTTLPILEIWGDRGKARPNLALLRIPDQPNICLVWIANASHSYLFEKPGDVASAIDHFVVETAGKVPTGVLSPDSRR